MADWNEFDRYLKERVAAEKQSAFRMWFVSVCFTVGAVVVAVLLTIDAISM